MVPLPRVNLDVVLVLPDLPTLELLATMLALVDKVLLLSVDHVGVAAEGGVGAKGGVALDAGEGSLPCVRSHVIRETGAKGKLLLTLAAFKLLEVRVVELLVDVEAGCGAVALAADVTEVLLVAVHCPPVGPECLDLLSGELTLLALVGDGALHVDLLHVGLEPARLPREEPAHPADVSRLLRVPRVRVADQLLGAEAALAAENSDKPVQM